MAHQDMDVRRPRSISRRTFLAYSGGTALTLYLSGGTGLKQALASIPGGTLDPAALRKFVTPLLVPPVMPRAATLLSKRGKPIDYYEISVRQFAQQVLPAGWPTTTVWGYGPDSSGTRGGVAIHNAPSLTIEAQAGRPVRVKWINSLKDAEGRYLPHLLPVDPTLHWANPGGGVAHRDQRPSYAQTPGRYLGPVPLVTHVHGAVGVSDESDGYAEAWYMPDASNVPAGYATTGTWYDFFSAKAAARFGAEWGAGYAIFQYPNHNRASTIWYHDHALGMTRLNVYAGPAGFYIVRGGPSDTVIDARTGLKAELPGPAPSAGDRFPPNKRYREIPIAIQDRSFNTDGSLFYPDTRAFFDGIDGPFLPATDVSPIWNPEFFGNTLIANGNTWPFLEVEKRRYRFRFLNGCQSRVLVLDFSGIPGVEVWQIGNDGGFLAEPFDAAATGKRLLLGLAERADVIVDFSDVPEGSFVLRNVGPDEPFGGGEPGDDFDVADPSSTGQVLQFRVGAALSPDTTTPARFLRLPAITQFATATTTRRLALLEHMSSTFADAPTEAMLGNVADDPALGAVSTVMRHWGDPVTENPVAGATEIWEFYNTTADAHPMHVHEVAFEVIDRQPIVVTEPATEGMQPTVELAGDSRPRPPEPWETGLKDTVLAYPGEVTRIRAQFLEPGQFVWHCHIVEHE
ncbi:MAG TPA: multicopper oxidase, partial [Steroidobacteraceae bacterium]|nr:multicopper oxidase [Steroidobacteraceae bacterium]